MLKLIIPILLLTGCASPELNELTDIQGEIVEFLPSPIVPKVKMDSTNTRQKSVCLPVASWKFLKLKEKSDACVYDYLSLSLDCYCKENCFRSRWFLGTNYMDTSV